MRANNFTAEQERAIRCVDKNAAVSAGAGSGKTRVLVERFLYILERHSPGRGPDKAVAPEILAVTFTRKAAAEMRQRIRQELLRKIRDGEGNIAVWQKELKALPRAVIGTLHSLCSALLRANPVECGLDPSFRVMEETENGEFLQVQLRDLLRRHLREKEADAVRLCEEYGSRSLLDQLFTLFAGGYTGKAAGQSGRPGQYAGAGSSGGAEHTQAAGLPEDPYEAALLSVETAVKQLREELTPELEEASSPANRRFLQKRRQKARQALTDLSLPANIAVLRDLNGGLSRIGKNKEDISRVKELLDTAVNYNICLRARKLAPVWERYLDTVAETLRKVKQETGLLSFDDLEEMALELLGRHPSVLAKCRRRFRYIMVDEFQDTNQRQRQLIYLLAGGEKDELRGNRLFVVGDPKQSIYRFRGAEVSVFASVRREIEEKGGESIQLADNFRTVDLILELCNTLFPLLMGKDAAKDVFYEALRPHKSSDIKPELRIFRFAKGTRAEVCRRKEAEGLALRLKELHTKEGIAYRDMAVLLQSMTHIGRLTAALQKEGVPCSVVDGRGFYDRMEIRDLISLFTFVTDPHNDLALLAVLRSVYMGIDDETLTCLCLAQRELNESITEKERREPLSLWAFLEVFRERATPVFPTASWPAPDKDGMVSAANDHAGSTEQSRKLLERARTLLYDLQLKGTLLNLPDFCRALDEALHPEAVLALQPDGEEQAADYRKLMGMARSFTVQNQGTVKAFAGRLRQLQEEQVREAAANAFAEDAVTLMTVHKSKGLEFPVVAIPFMDIRPQTDKGAVAWLPGKGLGISVRDENGELVRSAVLEDIRKESRTKEQEEKVRLLYVAMTRARDRLILTGGTGERPSEEMHWLNSFREKLPKDFDGIEIIEVRGETEAAGKTSKEEDPATRKEAEQADRTSMAVSASLPQDIGLRIAPVSFCEDALTTEFSASALQEYEYCPRRYFYQIVERIPPLEPEADIGKPGLPAAVLGNIVHRTLEKISRLIMEDPGKKAAAIRRKCFEQAAEEFAGSRMELTVEAEEMLEAYVEDPLYLDFVKRQRFAEYGFSLAFPPSSGPESFRSASLPFIFTGIIDAIAMNEDGSLEIVDYKSGRPPAEGSVRKGYAWQLALYRLAAEKLLDRQIRSASLHFIRNRSRWILSEEDYNNCLEEIRQICREIAGKKMEEEFRTELSACASCPFMYMCRR